MSNEFVTGALAAQEVNKQNPFNVIMNRFDEAFARKMKERQAEDADLRDLKKTFLGLQYKHNYDTELVKIQEEEKRKTGLLESERKGEISEAKPEETEGVFEGTPFGMVGKKYKKTGLSKEEKTLKNQDLSRATQLRKEFIDRPEVKEFVSIRNKVASMDSLLQNALQNDKASRLSLDQGLITLYNKITDPNSVVRESEYERTPQNLSLANRFSGAVEKLKKGGAGITNEDRKSLVWGGKIIANAQGKMFNEKIDQYSKIATDYGVDPGLVTSGITPHKDYSIDIGGKKQYKAGDTKIIKGITYQRNESGQWLPRS